MDALGSPVPHPDLVSPPDDFEKQKKLHPPGRRYGRRHRRHQHAAVEHPGGPGDSRAPPAWQPQGRRARGDPDAGEPLLRPLFRHPQGRPRLRRPHGDPAARRPAGLAPEGQQGRDPALPLRHQHHQRPARRRHPAHLAGRPAGLERRAHGQVAAGQDRAFPGLLQGAGHRLPVRDGQRLHHLRRLSLLVPGRHQPQPAVPLDRHQRPARPARWSGNHQRPRQQRPGGAGLHLDHLSRAPAGCRHHLAGLPGHGRQLLRQPADRLPPVPRRGA